MAFFLQSQPKRNMLLEGLIRGIDRGQEQSLKLQQQQMEATRARSAMQSFLQNSQPLQGPSPQPGSQEEQLFQEQKSHDVDIDDPLSVQAAIQKFPEKYRTPVWQAYLQKQAQKKQENKVNNETGQQKILMEFLTNPEFKKMSATDVLTHGLKAGLTQNNAQILANLKRMESRESRLSSDGIRKTYDTAIKEIDRSMNNASYREKKDLKAKRQQLIGMRDKDLSRFKKGDENFQLSLEAVEEKQRVLDPQNDADVAIVKKALDQAGNDKEKAKAILKNMGLSLPDGK